MARNSEKALLLLNRWQQVKQLLAQGQVEERPQNTNSVTLLIEAEKWRNQVTRDLVNKLIQIQDATRSEAQLLELNKKINKLVSLKASWNKRVVELGGTKSSNNTSLELNFAVTAKGERFYGAAKNISSVKNNIVEIEKPEQSINYFEFDRKLNLNYFGVFDSYKY